MANKYPRVCKYWEELFSPEFVFSELEVSIYSNATVFSRSIGRIDYIAKYKDITYLIEEDMAHYDKWHWVKILAYRGVYLREHPELDKDKVKCLVFIRDNEYVEDFMYMAESLGIDYITFTLRDCSISVSNTSNEGLKNPANSSAYVTQRDQMLSTVVESN